MTTTPINRVIQHILAACGGDGMADGELLTRFLSQRDDAALAALVRRHAPMVWGVCCRLLRSHHDAEDAFQATFLVLVKKAATLPNRETVGNWLYGVAHQTAVRMRAVVAKRGMREKQVTVMPEPATAEEYVWNDLAPVVDEELSRLPDKYRVLLVLCDLAGVTRKDVARQLDIPEGTAASRLATARAMLAKRLARRGVVLSSVLLGTVLSEQLAWSGVPATVLISTIKAATLVAAGHTAAGAISPTIAALTEGVMKDMFRTKIKSVLAVVLVVGFFCGVVGTLYQSRAAEPPKEGLKDKATASTTTAQKGDTLLPKATPQQGYSITSKVLEAAPVKPKEIIVLPKANAEDRQLIPIQIKDASPDRLAKMGGDDKLKIGTFLNVRVSSLNDKKVRLYCSFQQNELDKSGDNNICVIGSHVQVIRDIELDKPIKLVLTKDDKGGDRRWVEITVGKIPPDMSVETPRKKADKK